MQKTKIAIQVATLMMSVMIASNFLAAIPVATATPMNDAEINEATNVNKADLIYYTITTTNGKELHTFEIVIEKNRLTRARQMIMTEQMNAQDSIMEVANQIHLTEEQKSTIRNATSVRIMAGDSSYVDITGWLMLWCLPYGAFCHMYLTTMDAINIDTAINAAIALFAFLTLVLLETLAGAFVCAVVALTLAMIKVDYGAMYGTDHNEDNSFDAWFEVTFYQFACSYAIISTRRYLWLCTPVGAYIIRDYTKPPPEIKIKGCGGCRAYAI